MSLISKTFGLDGIFPRYPPISAASPVRACPRASVQPQDIGSLPISDFVPGLFRYSPDSKVHGAQATEITMELTNLRFYEITDANLRAEFSKKLDIDNEFIRKLDSNGQGVRSGGFGDVLCAP
jgi:hypothetical protein